ncbi:MAG: hypothetical protein ACR2FJ_05035 [Qipengyuania sp.]
MTDPVRDTAPSTRWFWVGAIVLLAVASVIFFLNADGDEELEEIPDYAVTTEEERRNIDLDLREDQQGLPRVRGADQPGEIAPETDVPPIAADPESQPVEPQ